MPSNLATWTPFRRDGERVVVCNTVEPEGSTMQGGIVGVDLFAPPAFHRVVDPSGNWLFKCCDCQHEWAADMTDFDPTVRDKRDRCSECGSSGPNCMSVPDLVRKVFETIEAFPSVTFVIRTSFPERVNKFWMLVDGFPNVILLANATTQAELDQRAEAVAKCGDLCGTVGMWLEPVEALDIAKYLDPVHTDGCLNCGYAGERYVDMGKFKTTDHGDLLCPECGHSTTTQFMGDDRLFDFIVLNGTDKPLHPSIVRSIRDQCEAAGVPFVFLSWGDWIPDCQRDYRLNGTAETWGVIHSSGRMRLVVEDGIRDWSQDPTWYDGEEGVAKVGREFSGSTLDGKQHNNWPKLKHGDLQ